MKKLKARELWGSKSLGAGECEDCEKRDDLDCKIMTLQKKLRIFMLVNCKLKVRREDGK